MKKTIDLLLKLVFTFTLIWFFYGMIKYPDGLISNCGENKYCGKQGQHYTVEDFEDYKRWGTINIIAFPATFLLGIINKKINKSEINN